MSGPETASLDVPDSAAGRKRLLAYAFAAADVLLEVAPDGLVTLAEGMVRQWFDAGAADLVGRPLAGFVAVDDQAALHAMLGAALARGRVPAQAIRLDGARAWRGAFSAMAIPGPVPRLCVTIGPLPVVPDAGALAPSGPASFGRLAEARARSGAGAVGLLELRGWARAARRMSAEARDALLRDVRAAIAARVGADATLGDLGEGQIGVLSAAPLPDAALREALQEAVRRAGAEMAVQGAVMKLAGEDLTARQRTRALRHALVSFARSGAAGLAEQGFADGLAGWISRVQADAGALRAGIAQGRFRLLFQPIVSLPDRRIDHYEALVRPLAIDGRQAVPQDYVTRIEAVGLAEEFDLAILDRALQTLAASRSATVAVNVSAQSMQSASFRAALLARIAAHPAERRRLLVELTETAEIEDVATAAAGIAALREAGVAVCIDDFGAGAAAFRYLRDFRVDGVKIDGSYVQDAARGARECGLVAGMVALAASVGAAVTAEMIETDEQAALMLSLGVQFGQGWLFGKPGLLPEEGAA